MSTIYIYTIYLSIVVKFIYFLPGLVYPEIVGSDLRQARTGQDHVASSVYA